MRKQAVIAALALMSLMQAGTASATITETRSDNWVYDPGVPNGRFDPLCGLIGGWTEQKGRKPFKAPLK